MIGNKQNDASKHIKIYLTNGDILEAPTGLTIFEIASNFDICPAHQLCAGKINGHIVVTTTVINQDCGLEFINANDNIFLKHKMVGHILSDIIETIKPEDLPATQYEIVLTYIGLIYYLRQIRYSKPKTNPINLICKQKTIAVVDKQNNDLLLDYDAKYGTTMHKKFYNLENLIFHAIMMENPSHIVVHNSQDYYNPSFLRAIDEIYENNLLWRTGCDICD
ncbi:MAG: hypothetical protein ATN36_03685 [Epulopiscium sp. Nele67-Bin005]|nr:MAG: hypothetical protein ATN36_03685 [Epulopiscium sp. Nele67-Bin005]